MDKKVSKSVILIGNPNVGKSVIFSLLSGKYAIISNYPGTTVEYTEGEIKIGGEKYKLIDTPGINSLLPMSEDEQVTRDLMLSEDIYAVIVVGDGKNFKRVLNLAFQVLEMGLPVIIVLNMLDEATELGIRYDFETLAKIVGVPIIGTIAIRRKGIDKIYRALSDIKNIKFKFNYGDEIEEAISKIEACLPDLSISRRTIALML